jgi:hypothetical protein
MPSAPADKWPGPSPVTFSISQVEDPFALQTQNMSLPAKNRGFVVTERGKIEIKEQVLANCNDGQILVKVKAVAINPADWKVCVFFEVCSY